MRRERSLDLGVLLAVKDAVEAVVEAWGLFPFLRHLHVDVERRDHAERGEHAEAVAGELVHEGEILGVERVLRRADAERVERHVALVVARRHVGDLRGERQVDVDELVAPFALGVQVVEDRLHRLRDVARVRRLLEAGDLRPLPLNGLRSDRLAQLEDRPRGALPAQLPDEPAADLEEPAVLFARVVTEPRDERRDVLGLQRVEELLREHGLGESRAGEGGDRVDEDVLLLPLDRQRARETDEAELRHGVVRLAEVAVDPGGRRREDDAAVAGVAHVVPRGVRDAEAAEDVDAVDEVPVLRRHLLERRVAQDPGVVHDDVDPLPRVERRLNDLRAVLNGVVVGNGFSARFLDLVDDLVRRGGRLAVTVSRAPQVVHDDLRAARREEQCVRAAQSVAGPRDDGDPSVEAQFVTHDR